MTTSKDDPGAAFDTWKQLNPNLSDSLSNVLISNIDDQGTNDIVRLNSIRWEVSWDGRSTWKPLKKVPWNVYSPSDLHLFTGRFDNSPGSDLLLLDTSRSNASTATRPTP